jgi:hypothetical protein
MEAMNEINIVFGTVISLLLSVVAYFIRQLHSDFRKMEKDIIEVKTTTQLIKTEFKSSHDLLNQRVAYLEKRMDVIELLTNKNKSYE